MNRDKTENAKPALSFVIPVYNERETILEVCRACSQVAGRSRPTHEIIVVDDGSSDGTSQLLREAASSHPNLRVIFFQRNFGKSAALAAGMDLARGDLVVTLDADGQDDPGELPALLKALDEGNDVVVGWKRPRRDPPLRIVSSRLFNLLVSLLAGRRLHDCNSGFKVMRRSVIPHLDLYGERHRFVPLLALWKGFRVAEVPVSHRPRRFGRSKYGAGRLLAGFFDLWSIAVLTRFRHKPLHFFGTFGLLAFALGFIVLAVMTILRLTVEGFWFGRHLPWLFFGILLVVVGIQVFTTGLICELIVNLRPESKTEYLIKEIVNPPE